MKNLHRVKWLRLWKHRWMIVQFLSQVRHGDPDTCIRMVASYGGTCKFAMDLYRVCKDSIDA